MFHLIDRAGDRRVFATLDDLVKEVPNRDRMGPVFDPHTADAPARIHWRVLDNDDLGVADDLLDAAFEAMWLSRRYPRGSPWWSRRLPTPPFRQAPVPFTGRGRFGRFYRHPRTSAEIAANAAALADGIPVRGRRLNIPTIYDDLRRHVDRSWKSHRKTQWR